jgi:hypothetical protein
MVPLGKVAAGLVAIAIVSIALGGLAYGVVEDPAVVGPLAAAAVAIGVAVFQRRWEKSQELDRLHRDEMSPIYRVLVETIKDHDAFTAKPKDEQEAFFKDLSTSLILHGPSSVVMAWNAWLRSSNNVTPATFVAWERLLRAVRGDLGLDSSQLASGELLRLFLNEDDDPDSRVVWEAIRSAPSS